MSVSPAPRLEPGAVLAGYRLERLLGEGGMGLVYEATQLSLNRTVALKIVAPALSADTAFRARFRREGLVQARLEHPNIVTVYESGEWQDVLFLAMRLVEGPPLKELIIARELDVGRSLRILVPIAGALDAAHEQRLVHRDVKPQNILVGADDHPYLADFGLTKGPDATAHTRTGSVMGSLDYISPEQIRGEPATSSSDVYALAAVLFECLTRVVPYPRESDAALLYAHVNDPPPSVLASEPNLPPGLDDLIARAMSKEPADRPRTASALMHEASVLLEGVDPALFAGGPRPATRPRNDAELDATLNVGAPVAPSEQSRRRLSRRGRFAAALGVATVVIAVGGFETGHASNKGSSRAESTTHGGPVAVTVPSTWRAPVQTPTIPGLAIRDPLAREDPASGGLLVAGMAPGGGGARLLPASLLAKVRALPAGEPVKLGKGEALRYRNVSVAGMARPVTLVVAPNSSGVTAVGCVSPEVASAAFQHACERAAASLRVSNANALKLGPYAEYGRALAGADQQLRFSAQRSRDLASAGSRSAQAGRARALAGEQAAAAARIAKAPAGPDARALNATLEAAATATASGYRAMASAAGSGDEIAYDAARRRTEDGLRAEHTALEHLRAAGYGG